jgi:AraC family transcriptional regulator
VKPETQSFYQLAVQRTVERVIASLDEALDLERLARAAALSPFHFHRIFRGMVGETPLELHRRLRMERAAFRLLEEETSVTTIAVDAGYDTHEAFSRAFRSRYACSPSEFRHGGRGACAGRERAFQIEIAARSGIHFSAQPSTAIRVHFLKGEQTMNVEKKQMPALRLATLRHIGPYHRISEAFGRLGELAGRAGILSARPTMLALYHDDPETTPEAELRSDAALVIAEDAKVPQGLVEQRLAAGRYARTTHVGPYEELGDAWSRFMGHWLPESGERMGDGVAFEIYVNNPMEVPKEKLITELYLPLSQQVARVPSVRGGTGTE